MKMSHSVFISLLAVSFSMVTLSAGLAVMSVDFGNEFMKIALVKPGVPMEIVLNKESTRKTPTVVTLKDGERLVGEPALNVAIRHPKYGYRYLLDVLGKHFDNPLVELYRKRFPFYEMEKDPDTGSVLFKHDDGTLYSPEVLVSMMLQKAKEYAEAFAEQSINEAVITVPCYFNQAERRAMARAAELAGLRLLQLISDNTAVALNYGVFRRKIFNSTAINYMFFDIGASGTTATVVAYQEVKVKSPVSGVVETFPQLTVKGVGFDRTLGGVEFQLRLRDFLLQEFLKVKKSKKDVTKDLRALQKLYKEAGRVKQVLSANVDHFAQVEGLFEDEDFRTKITREQFENLCQDLIDRVNKVVQDALATAEMSMGEIEEVILMGGGTRIPKVQEAIKHAIGREELGKGINTDEAAALGAVYQAANLGKGFRVKKFGIKEAVLYPIQVEFERIRGKDDEQSSESSSKTVKRVLFGRMQSYPQKKVMTFNKHTTDFAFEVKYGDLSFLTADELKEFGSSNLQTVSLSGVEEALSSQGKDAELKGIKAHFRMDDSGILFLDKVDAQFEKTVPVEAEKESTLSKISSTISNLFGGSKEDGAKDSEENLEDRGAEEGKDRFEGGDDASSGPGTGTDQGAESDGETVNQMPNEDVDKNQEAEEAKNESEAESKSESKETAEEATKGAADEESTSEKTANEEKKTDDTSKKIVKEDKKEEPKNKTTTLKVDIKMRLTNLDLADPSEETMKNNKKMINEMKKAEEERQLLAKAKNEIESFVFNTQDKLEQREYKLCSTEEERIEISAKLSEASDWMIELADDTPRKVYEDKLKELKKVTRAVFDRVKELEGRPAAVEAFNSIVNHTEYFLRAMKNFTGEDMPFTQVEFDVLEKLLNESKDWNKTVHSEQAKKALTEPPVFTTEDMASKISALDRELKYLVNKMKSYKPKPKPKPSKDENTTDSTSDSGSKTGKASDSGEPFEKINIDDLDRDILEKASDDHDSKSKTSGSHELDDEL